MDTMKTMEITNRFCTDRGEYEDELVYGVIFSSWESGQMPKYLKEKIEEIGWADKVAKVHYSIEDDYDCTYNKIYITMTEGYTPEQIDALLDEMMEKDYFNMSIGMLDIEVYDYGTEYMKDPMGGDDLIPIGIDLSCSFSMGELGSELEEKIKGLIEEYTRC
jgi:hypothetical protein